MHTYTLFETVLGAIDEDYPPEAKPAQNAYLKSLYEWQPEPSAAMLLAITDALICVRRITEAHPGLLEIQAEAIGLEQFAEGFSEVLAEQALGTFRARKCAT